MIESTSESSHTPSEASYDSVFRSQKPMRVALVAMIVAIVCLLILTVSVAVIGLMNAKLSNPSLVFPLLGGFTVAGIITALIGLIAGVVDLLSSSRSRSATFIPLFVNGFVCAFVFLIVIIGVINT